MYGDTNQVKIVLILRAKTLKCFQCVGSVHPCIGEKLSQGYIQNSFLVIGNYKKIWNHTKIFSLVRPQYCPTFFCQSSIFPVCLP